MDEEIKYIPYGTDEIDYNQFINNAANEVLSYINQLPWSNKRKESFLRAYQDLINKGITGASNTSGVWKINYGLDAVPLETLSKRDREMYGEAAYFLQLQMSRVPTKASLAKKEEDKKSKLPLFDNKYFTGHFENHIANKLFGGQDWKQSLWNDKDERGENGLRGIDVRKQLLAEQLKNYSDSLKEEDLNFENSPFENLADFKTKVASAIEALNGNDEKLIKDKLNLIGLNYDDYLSNGGDDPVTLKDGTTTTYGKWAEYYNALKAEEEAKAQKKAEAEAKANFGVLSISSGNKPIDAIYNTENYNKWLALTYGSGQQGFEKINLLIQTLLERSYNLGKSNGLNSAERKLLGNLIHYIRTNNPKYLNYNLTPEEEGELSKHNSMKGRRLQDFVRLPWQIDGRYTYADKSGNIYFLKPQNEKLLLQLAFTKSAEYNNYVKNFGKTQLQINNEAPVLSLDKDILISDVTSMLGDIVSLGGGYAGAAGGITTLLSDLYGDIRRGKDIGSTLKNLGANIAWGAAGLIPGAKLGKLTKNAARIYAGLLSAGILMDDDVLKSWKNLIEGKDISARDFENFKWTLHAITGGTNAVRGHFTEKNIDKQIKANNKPTIETKSGNKSITQEQVNKINKVGGRKGLKAAEEAFKKATGAEAKKGTFNFLEEPRAWYNPTRYSQRLRNWISDDERLTLPKTTQSVNTQAINRLLEMDKSKPIIGIGNPFNKRFWTEGGPNRGGLTFALAPYKNGNSNNSSNNIEVDENPTRILYPSKGNSYLGARPVYDSKNYSPNLVKKEYKNIIEKQNYTKNKVTEGTYKLIDDDIKVTESSGRFTIKLNNLVIGSNLELKRVKEIISTLVKENKQSANKVTSNAYKLSTKDIGRILLDLKRKGWLKQGGTIDNLDTEIKEILKTL